jgi:hypothetical protein
MLVLNKMSSKIFFNTRMNRDMLGKKFNQVKQSLQI